MYIPWTCPLTIYLNTSLRMTFFVTWVRFWHRVLRLLLVALPYVLSFVYIAGVFVRTSTAGPVKKLIAVSLSVEFIGKYNSFAFTRSVTSARNFNAPKGETRRTNEPVFTPRSIASAGETSTKHQVLSIEYLLIYLSCSLHGNVQAYDRY